MQILCYAQNDTSEFLHAFLRRGLDAGGPGGSAEFLSVMLSEAKHLQYLVQNKEMQIFRCAQDDSLRTFSAACKAPMTSQFSRRR